MVEDEENDHKLLTKYMIIKQNTTLACHFKGSVVKNPGFVWTQLPKISSQTITG